MHLPVRITCPVFQIVLEALEARLVAVGVDESPMVICARCLHEATEIDMALHHSVCAPGQSCLTSPWHDSTRAAIDPGRAAPFIKAMSKMGHRPGAYPDCCVINSYLDISSS